jgi:WD40-like Beta Propeller Repeat
MNDSGYYHHPAISGDTVYLVSEDDLWSVPSAGGIARRLTSGLGASSCPAVSPDGRWLAFSSALHLESSWLYVLWILLAFVLMLLKRVQMSDGKPQPASVSTGNQLTEPGSLTQKKAGSLATSAPWHRYTFRASFFGLPFH